MKGTGKENGKMIGSTTTTATNITSSIERGGRLNTFAPTSALPSHNSSQRQPSGIGEVLRAANAADVPDTGASIEVRCIRRVSFIPILYENFFCVLLY